MGGPCSTHCRDEKCKKKKRSENLKGRDHSEDLGVVRKIILECILGK
jgi:hypothetical protein